MTGQSSQPAFASHFWLVAARLVWLSLLLLSVYTLVAATWIDPTFAPLMGWSQDTYRAAAAGLGIPTIALDSIHQFFATLTRLSFLAIGGLLYWRKRNDPMAFFTSVLLITFSVTAVFVGKTAQEHPLLRLPLNLVQAIGQTGLMIICFVFPDGRWFPRWSALPTLASGGILLSSRFEAVRSSPWFLAIGIPALIWAFAGVPAQIYRYRRLAGPEQRQQIKWGVFGVAGFLTLSAGIWVIFGWWLPEVVPALSEQTSTALLYEFIRVQAMSLSDLVLPVSLAIAILRYRLWDIDVIIRRTMLYAAMTGTLGLVYLGSIVFLQQIVRAITGEAGQSTITIVVSTLVIAALFTPLRRRLQDAIDRRFYRRKYDAEQALASFSALARQEVDLEEISTRLLALVQETVQPVKVNLWLKERNLRG